MRRILAWAGLALFWHMGLSAAEQTWNHDIQKASDLTLKGAYRTLVEPQPAHGKTVSAVEFARPGFRLFLEQGTLFQEDAELPGGARGYGFAGTAKVDFSVADPVERDHFQRYAGVKEWKGITATAVYILPTSPSDPFEGPFPETQGLPVPWADLKKALHWNGFDTLASLYNRQSRNPADVLVLFQVGKDIWCYSHDSESEEEVSLRKLGRAPGSEAWWWDPAVSLHLNPKGELVNTNSYLEMASKVRADLKNMKLDLTFDGKGEITRGLATLDVGYLKKTNALCLAIHPMLPVKSVKAGERVLPFLQTDFSKAHAVEEVGLLVVFPAGEPPPGTLAVEYGGPLFEPSPHGSLMSKEEDYWYPRIADLDGATFETAVTLPEGLEAITIGEPGEKTVSGGQATYRFQFADKATLSTLAIGKFRHYREAADGIEVDVAFPDNVYTAKKQDQEKSIRVIVFNCLKINQKLYGPQKYKRLGVSECAWGHGRGFPTLLLISALIDPNDAQFFGTAATLDQALVSHETGHQWWGNIVEPLTYRDTWISEGLAELAALDYAMVIHGPKKVKEALEAYEFNLDSLLAYSRKPTWQEGPILLGPRLATSLEPGGGYQTIVYTKAAWAMVNLRKVAMLAPPGGSIQPFYNGLQDFLRTYYGRKATTEDFRKVMERHLKMDLGWFFDQYFRRTEIPSATVKARAEQDGGQWKLLVEGTQDTDFRLCIPVEVSFGDKKKEVIFQLQGKEGRQEFPLEAKPSGVKVDPGNETLARVKS